jgi:hypothetical protein
MSKKEDFHPALSTLDVAKFQLLENGFAGVVNGVTLIPAKDARTIEANHLNRMITELLTKSHAEEYIDSGEALNLLVSCKAFVEQYPEDPQVAVLVVYRPAIKDGEANVQPMAKIIDPWEVIEPEFAHTDGAGNVKDETAGTNDNATKPRRSNGDGRDS